MSVPTVSAPVTPRKSSLLKRLIQVLLTLVLLVLAGSFVWVYRLSHSPLPQLDGSIAIPGLKASVTVQRDAHGVPNITAASLDDLFVAQGYITAQDRLWQMDMARRAAAGELSEILPAATFPPGGPGSRPTTLKSILDIDKRQRIFRLRAVAEAIAQRLPARDRAFFEAYTRGINAYMEQHRTNLPLEFTVLGYTPKPWTVADSVMTGLNMSQALNTQYEPEYWREKVAARLSPELLADLYPVSSWRDHPPADAAKDASVLPPARDENDSDEERPASSVTHLHGAGAVGDCEACIPGSNNWVVSGAHTVSGKPLLSNDMHLGHRLPGVWYEVQLHSGDYNMAGFSLPGLPFVVVGHNQRIAWGFTNLNPDVQDLFIERFNATGEYQTPTGWQKPEVAHEVIHVKNQPDVNLDVVITRHGPIITDLLPGENRKIALEWLIYDYERAGAGIPLFDMNTAQNWQQFRQALSNFATPSQNVVYADVDGHIGYQPMGRVPIRASGDGTAPVPGADGKHDWTGYLPFDKMPDLYDPPSGIIATANSRITPNGYPYLLSTQWVPPYRAERIYRVLESGAKFGPPDMLRLQTDITSDYDRFFADRFVYAIDHSPKATDRVRKAAAVLRGFDGRMLADAAAPTIEVKARAVLAEKILRSKLGDDWPDYEWPEAAVALENIVQKQIARWLPTGYGNFDDLLTDSVAEAIANAPADLSTWKYGQQYPVEISHDLYSKIPVVSSLLKSSIGPGLLPQSGGSYTVKQVGRKFGPSERMTVDFSNLDNSTFNIVIGESGQIFSPYYMDQWDAWYNNKTFTLPYSEQAVHSAASHSLTLTPGQ